MNRSPSYAATIPANGTRFQVLATLATFDGSGSAQGSPHVTTVRATKQSSKKPQLAGIWKNCTVAFSYLLEFQLQTQDAQP